VRRLTPLRALLLPWLCWACLSATLNAQTVAVTLKVSVTRPGTPRGKQLDSAGAVVWLTPSQPTAASSLAKPGHYRLTQKDKQFTPHLLVIPTGSTVDFPNLDPFFHNVFSLFNGKRFDLGLYESGSSRTVHFNRDGVSYIFCNIHPEMSAIVITLPTPYYDVSSAEGEVTLRSVPPGSYDFHVWIEGASARDLQALDRKVLITSSETNLGSIEIKVDAHAGSHKNKFGEDYQSADEPIY
jgi:plastocyanin